MSNTANDYYRAAMKIQEMIDRHQNDIDYLVIIVGLLTEEEDQHDPKWYRAEHKRIIRGMHRHSKQIRRLQRRYNRYLRTYHKLNRNEGWS